MDEIKYRFFWGGIYSNWYRCKFFVNGTEYNCSEQYMMEQKALTFNDLETAELIMISPSPREQKALGRKIKNYDQATWDKVKYEIVKHGCRAKFAQNPQLKAMIIADYGKVFVEASPEDAIWGIGFDEDDALQNKEKWGENLLGKLLTELSKEFAENE